VLHLMAMESPKLTPSHTLDRWSLIRGGGPVHAQEHLAALHIACRFYDLGRTRKERLALAAAISKLRNMDDPWLRGVVLKLRHRCKRA
jgi:hypothetical protein